eukprot:TRINITY_DN5850_c0_g1_i3.p1 TRINITY_DN5850_c0_g1~~TRINITY_DN5850_c0_g1_i3.p1  ORF type:complete len:123 (-),score=14.13 TRINITY_DN5850_c0_g1_i3:189-557(-)
MSGTITIRVIKSFEYRTIKPMILRDIDLSMKTSELKEIVDKYIQTQGPFLPYRAHKYDTFKIFHKAHSHKPNNLVINLETDDGLLDTEKTLAEQGVEHETEISYYLNEDYQRYRQNPEVKWE